MNKLGLIILICIVCIAINWLALLAGWWWLTSLVGLLIGLFLRPAGPGFLVSFCAGSLGWGMPLLVLATHAPVMQVANAVESVIGLSATKGVLIIVLTVVLGCVLSVAGTWVGFAGRKIVTT